MFRAEQLHAVLTLQIAFVHETFECPILSTPVHGRFREAV
jgi:hypothetical protein